MSHSVFNQSFDVWQYCNILCHYSFFSSVCVWWGDINNTATPRFWPQKWTLPIMKTFPCQKTLQCCIYTQHVQCNFSLILVQTIYWIAKDFCQVQYFRWESSLFLIAHISTAIFMENQNLGCSIIPFKLVGADHIQNIHLGATTKPFFAFFTRLFAADCRVPGPSCQEERTQNYEDNKQINRRPTPCTRILHVPKYSVLKSNLHNKQINRRPTPCTSFLCVKKYSLVLHNTIYKQTTWLFLVSHMFYTINRRKANLL